MASLVHHNDIANDVLLLT